MPATRYPLRATAFLMTSFNILVDVPFTHTQEQMLKEWPWDVATLYLRHYEP